MKSKRTKPAWLLTIASAYGLVPGCGDDGSDQPPVDGGVVADAGHHPGLDAGIVVGPPDAGRPGLDAGIVAAPPDAGADSAQDASTGVTGLALPLVEK